MAQSHHRKKHKAHLREFQQKNANMGSAPKRKAAGVFTIVGCVLGLAVTYFSLSPNITTMVIGTLSGGVVGYLFGRNMDKRLTKKG